MSFSETWWPHQMETFFVLRALCAVNSPVTGEFPSQRPVTGSCDVFFDLCLNSSWVNNRDIGDLRHHRTHYDVIVMVLIKNTIIFSLENACTNVCKCWPLCELEMLAICVHHFTVHTTIWIIDVYRCCLLSCQQPGQRNHYTSLGLSVCNKSNFQT